MKSLSLEQLQGWDISSIPTMGYQGITWTVLFAMVFGIPWKLGLKKSKWFKANFAMNKYVWWAHGTLTFSILWICQPRNLGWLLGAETLDSTLSRVMQQVMVSLLAIILWDFGYVHSGFTTMVLGNCHHLGAFLAFLFGPGWSIDNYIDSDEGARSIFEQQVRLDSWLFGWLWMIHSLSFFLEVILPLVGIKIKEGSRSHSVDIIRHIYSLVSVYFFHQYLNYAPDRFFTYQTSSLLVMATGRYFINCNWKGVDFLRRVEFPGFWVVLLDRVLGFHDKYCHRSLAIVVGVYAAYVLYAVFLKKTVPVPERYFGPDENPVLVKFLEDETSAVRGKSTAAESFEAAQEKFSNCHSMFGGWWKTQYVDDERTYGEQYPIHDCVMMCQPGNQEDAQKLVKHLDVSSDVDINEPVKELKNLRAVQLAAWSKYSYECTLLLLKRGANPYLEDTRGSCAVQSGMNDAMKLSILKPGSLGYSEGFWERFNTICLEKSPSKVLTRKEKFLRIVKAF
jgi:hypothetical protein